MQSNITLLRLSDATTNAKLKPAHLDNIITLSCHPDELFSKIQTIKTDVMVLHEQCILADDSIERLQAIVYSADNIGVCSPTNNFNAYFSPLAEGFIGPLPRPEKINALLNRVVPAIIFDCEQISEFCCYIRYKAIQSIDFSLFSDFQGFFYALCANDFRVVLCNAIYIELAQCIHKIPELNFDPDTRAPTHPLSATRIALTQALTTHPFEKTIKHPVRLHIIHSWGGGADRWLSLFCEHDQQSENLVLRSRGQWQHQCYGQIIELFANATDTKPLQSWTLVLANYATAIHNHAYVLILDAIIQQYHVNSLYVSSLIGHSLDVFSTKLPSIMILHDYYPYCPALNLYFNQTCKICQRDDIMQCTQNNRHAQLFSQINIDFWLQLRLKLIEKLQQDNITLVSPTKSVITNLTAIEPGFTKSRIKIIPHGIPDLDWEIDYPSSRDKPLKILLLGRLSQGKGFVLLNEILKEATQFADFHLYGCGKHAESLQNTSSLQIIYNYSPHQLPELLRALKPDLGLILSEVPETFSYTLSELFQSLTPVVASDLGSFSERIIHQQTGFLFPPNKTALLQLLTMIDKHREQLDAIRNNLRNLKLPKLSSMITQYTELSTTPVSNTFHFTEATIADYKMNDMARESWLRDKKISQISEQLSNTYEQISEREKEIINRTNWARSLENERQNQFTQMTSSIQHQQSNAQEAISENKAVQQKLNTEKKHAKNYQTTITKLNKNLLKLTKKILLYEKKLLNKDKKINKIGKKLGQFLIKIKESNDKVNTLRNEYESTTSWRITSPLRYIVIKVRRLKNSLRYAPHNIALLFKKLRRSVQIRGLRHTLSRVFEIYWGKADKTENIRIQDTVIQPMIPMQIPCSISPKVSIIIPIYNQQQYTYNCLQSIASMTLDVAYEVIVVDDCSADDSLAMLKTIGGISVYSNEQNIGFIGTCNHGADHAIGEYLVFLNNDTKVCANWLIELLDTYRLFPNTGLTGAKLVYPDGRLQEAGGTIFADGSGWNYGRFDDPDKPQYNYCRQVDYISGAAIMIEKALFFELGCFDAHYAPAYYEDTDLAFKVRGAGKQVIYQPKSVVIHYEGITSGTDLNSGTKQYQVTNQKKFLKRWKKQLKAQHHPAGTDIEIAKERGIGDHVCVIDACTPMPDKDSGSLRMINILKILTQMHYKVTFFADNLLNTKGYTNAIEKLGIQVLYTPHVASTREYMEQHGKHFKHLIISRYYIAENYFEWIRNACPQAQIIFDTVDLHYLREQREASLTQNPNISKQAKKTRQHEQKIINEADITLVVSSFEKNFLATEMPSAKVAILSNIHQAVGCQSTFHERQHIMFIGGFSHPPNIDAMLWFCQDIYPLIVAKIPEIKLYIIGNQPPKEITDLAQSNIEVTGYINDISPFLNQCILSIAPLRYGAGVKGKINTSMSYGLPVVATHVATEGMSTTHEFDAMIAQDEGQFAAHVIRLCHDELLWHTLSLNGLKNIEQNFSVAVATEALKQIFKTHR